MTTGFTVVYDATHDNIASLPPNAQYMGYVTGEDGVPWTQADFAAKPSAIRLDQTPASTPWDVTADGDDMENGAVQLNELAGRAKLRMASFKNGTRPGQRSPFVYMSQVNVTAVVNSLIAGGVPSGVGLFIANWNLTDAQAVAEVMAAAGPFPIIGVQFHNAGNYDVSIVSSAWMNTLSAAILPVPVEHSGIADGWRFCPKCSSLVHITGSGNCAGGGHHDTSQSHNYSVSWNDAVA